MRTTARETARESLTATRPVLAPTRGTRRVRPFAAGALATLALLVGGCSLGGEQAMSDSAGGSVAEERGAADLVDRDLGAPGKAPGTGSESQPGADGANRTVVQTRAVIRNGEIHVVTKNLGRARAAVDDLLQRHGGYLAGEDTTNDRKGRPQRSVLVLRVPEPAFGTVMSELGTIGRTERADRSSDDVTTEVIDIDTRVATQEASLRRLRTFLRRATNVDDMIRVESEMATRQAALESLKAQQKYLADQTSMSTVTAHLRTPAAPPPEKPEEDAGFLAGLGEGWTALKGVLVEAATVTGVLLPFAVLIGLLAVPAWLLLRTSARRRPAAVAVPAGPPPTQDA